jgi:adenylosuccinate synthase
VTHVTVVVGGQFGSEGKGAIAGHLGKSMGRDDIAVRVAGPNAGHTAYDSNHREWKLRAVPVAAVTSPDCDLHIAAGSEIDTQVLIGEIHDLDDAGFNVSRRLSIHPSATVLEPRHINDETSLGIVGRIGSTGKGIGAARADRIMRNANTALSSPTLEPFLCDAGGPFDFGAYRKVVIEGTQGYGLGLHTDFYPTVTSSDTRAIDFLAMAGVSPWATYVTNLDIIVVARVYPIRVAGPSGPLKGETTWGELGLPEERTTVTQKIRRVGDWDEDLVLEAIIANGGGIDSIHVSLALTMLDQKYPAVRDAVKADALDGEPIEWIETLENRLSSSIDLVGTGPETVVEL